MQGLRKRSRLAAARLLLALSVALGVALLELGARLVYRHVHADSIDHAELQARLLTGRPSGIAERIAAAVGEPPA